MTFPCVKCKIHNYKNTQIRKYKALKRPNFTFTLHLHLQIDSASSRSIERYFLNSAHIYGGDMTGRFLLVFSQLSRDP